MSRKLYECAFIDKKTNHECFENEFKNSSNEVNYDSYKKCLKNLERLKKMGDCYNNKNDDDFIMCSVSIK